MGWFTAKDAPSDEPVRGKTIDDRSWFSLQSRAAKADPDRARFGSAKSVEGSRRSTENYRNRHRN
jgi:hypothetical protein